MAYRIKPIEVQAEQYVIGKPLPPGCTHMWGSVYFPFETGAIPVTQGDWVVTYANGKREIVSDEDFLREFEEIPVPPVVSPTEA